MWNKLIKDEKGFTGLEAAIVLIAFVVVAAVFSYVMLGAGFFTTQKSQEVVHTGVTQASSSVELSGAVIAKGGIEGSGTVNNEIDTVLLTLQQTSGGTPVDIANTLIVVSAPGIPPTEVKYDATGPADAGKFTIDTKYNANTDNLIDKFEKFDVTLDIDAIAAAATTTIGANDEFQIEIKPPQGASFTIHRKAPAAISDVMILN